MCVALQCKVYTAMTNLIIAALQRVMLEATHIQAWASMGSEHKCIAGLLCDIISLNSWLMQRTAHMFCKKVPGQCLTTNCGMSMQKGGAIVGIF